MSICVKEGKGPATLFDMFETMQEGCQQQSGGCGGEPEVTGCTKKEAESDRLPCHPTPNIKRRTPHVMDKR